MIVPRDRLLIVFAAVAVPAGLAGATPTLWPIAVASIAVLIAALCADAIAAARRILRIDVSAPELTRFVRGRAGAVALTVRWRGANARQIRLGLPVPEGLGCNCNDITFDAPASAAAAAVRFDCSPRRRGTYVLETAVVGVASPLRLWEARRQLRIHAEIRVYPDLLTGQKSIAPLLLHRQAGLHVQRQVGRGREFEKLREYLPGDAMSDIHWKATARRGRPVTRVYQIERTQEIYAVLDCSRLSTRVSGDDTILERYVSAALALTLASRQQGDLFGIITFSDTVHTFLRAGSGTAHYDACRNALLAVQPRRRTPDYNEVFSAIQTRLRRRAMLFVLTELDDPVLAEDFQIGVRDVARRHVAAAASVRPPGVAPIFETDAASPDEVYERLAGHFAWRRFQDVRMKLRIAGVRFTAVEAGQLGAEVARTYLNVKRRQIL